MSLDPSQVTAVLVTRGDVDLGPILRTLPYGETIIWDNSTRPVDYKVFGRYIALQEASNPVVYFQDDDCLVTCHKELLDAYEPGVLVGNAFDDPKRLAKYHDTTLLGWGSLFDKHLPWKAFQRYARYYPINDQFIFGLGEPEIVFGVLTPTVTITEGVEWLDENGPVFERENRTWKHPDFYALLDQWLERARDVRDRD